MDFYDIIRNRRSHRAYKPDLPPREALERIVAAAYWAPSAMNLQAWEITVMAGKVRDDFVALCSQAITRLLAVLQQVGYPEDRQQEVARFFKNRGGAPVVVAVTIAKSADPTNNANVQSGAALMENLLLAAQAEGLGSCWMAGVRFVEKELLEFL